MHRPCCCRKSRPQVLISAKTPEVSHCFRFCQRRRQTEQTVESASGPVLCGQCWFFRLRSRRIDSIYATLGYTEQGVEFFAGGPQLFISGSAPGFSLCACPFPQSTGPRTWIIAEQVVPASAIGIFSSGRTTVSIFDVHNQAIGAWEAGGSGGFFFAVISTDELIGRVTIDRGRDVETIGSFFFTPIPEPAAGIILGAATLALAARRRRRATRRT